MDSKLYQTIGQNKFLVKYRINSSRILSFFSTLVRKVNLHKKLSPAKTKILPWTLNILQPGFTFQTQIHLLFTRKRGGGLSRGDARIQRIQKWNNKKRLVWNLKTSIFFCISDPNSNYHETLQIRSGDQTERLPGM